MRCLHRLSVALWLAVAVPLLAEAREAWPKPYDKHCTERENVFAFTKTPAAKLVGEDRYEITFAVKGYCDVTVAMVGPSTGSGRAQGKVVRHLGSGVLGRNAPPPFQKNSLKQTLYWNGKDDLDVYHKHPQKLKVRVMLGMKLRFDKFLGPTHPKALPGYILGITIDKDGAYVLTRGAGGFNHVVIRKFDHDAKYVQSLLPPPASYPETKLAGRAYIEYEPGKRDHHGSIIGESIGYSGNQIPCLYGKGLLDIQPVIVGSRLFFCSAGTGYHSGREPTKLHYIYTDGATDVKGLTPREFFPWIGGAQAPRFAASADGKWLYMTGAEGGRGGCSAVLRCSVEGSGRSAVFIGKMNRRGEKAGVDPGSTNDRLSGASGIDTDSAGRIYVADTYNNRLQVFSPEGKFLKTIRVDRPHLVCVHKRTGAVYVQHKARVRGTTVSRITKFSPFDAMKEVYHVDGILTSAMAVDSWTPKPRIWIGGGLKRRSASGGIISDSGPGITVWEETGATLKQISGFVAETKKSTGRNYFGPWSGSVYDKVVCDPTRETAWYCWKKAQGSRIVFDLPTGKLLGEFRLGGPTDDIAFDKRGYLHCHFNPGFYMPGVGRLDPDHATVYDGRGRRTLSRDRVFTLKEVPYNYGVATDRPHRKNWMGALPVKDQPGAKYFQDGFGVNMRGDVAEQCNIYHVPKMADTARAFALAGRLERLAQGKGQGPESQGSYAAFLRSLQEREKRGEAVFFIPRSPGAALAGATIWTFDGSGELRDKLAVNAGGVMAGVMINEDGDLYFTTLRARNIDGKRFLLGRGGNLGTDKPLDPRNRNPFTGTYIKVPGKGARFLLKKAPVRAEPAPSRPVDLAGTSLKSPATWVQGAEWMYSGVTPVSAAGCTCPSSRPHLDWFKRSYLPEAYRHSIGIVDTGGNLIMHVGTYGNHDDALAMRKNPDDIRMTLPRFISGTDNYVCFDDWGERLVVLRIGYHAEETAGIEGLK